MIIIITIHVSFILLLLIDIGFVKQLVQENL